MLTVPLISFFQCNARNERVLTRVTVVNKDLEIVYDELVKPHEEITDYLTEYVLLITSSTHV